MTRAVNDDTPSPDAALIALCNDYMQRNEQVLALSASKLHSDARLTALTGPMESGRTADQGNHRPA